jgi:hypothetical protein
MGDPDDDYKNIPSLHGTHELDMIYDKEKFDSLYHSVNAMISSSNIRKNIKTERNTERTVPASLGAADLNDFRTFQAATLIRHMHNKNWCPMKEYAPLKLFIL